MGSILASAALDSVQVSTWPMQRRTSPLRTGVGARFTAPIHSPDGAPMGLQRSPDWGCDGAADEAAGGATDGAP